MNQQSTGEPLVFEDEEELYSEGLDVVAEHIKVTDPTTGTELSTSHVTISERTRTLLPNQGATVSKRSPSPMDIDSVSEEMQEEQERATINSVAQTTATKSTPSTNAMRSTSVPSKRPTEMQDVSSSLSPSPSALPQPAKRLHTMPSVRRRSAQPQSNGSDFGADLDPFPIAHDAAVQCLLDESRLAWGTVYEIARGVTKGNWTWAAVTRDKIELLRGTNTQAAHKVAAVMQGREVPRVAAGELWAEYDREQEAIIENRGRGLGGMGEWKGKDGWYGGRIQQVGRLVRVHNRFSVQLEKPEIRRSHRFSRFLGSRRILQIRVSDDLLYKHGIEVRTFLSSCKFVLCGRVFLPFHAKEGSVYMLETDQNFERVGSRLDGDNYRTSLNSFVQWHNPLGLNSQQPISKWSTRWALGLSTSVPTIELEHQNIFEIPDIYVSPQDWEGKAPAEKVLTDGCGLINGAALTQIMRLMGYSSRPTAVQGRIGGSKGMWVLHPHPLEQVPDGPAKIWIRPSQTKIKLGPGSELGRAQRTFDLLAPSRVTSPSRLSSQTLTNLSHHGISHQVLKDLMALGLKEEIQSLVDWTHPESMISVWKAVERAGAVVVSRLRRLLAGQARALGLGQLRPLDDQGQEDEEGDGGSLLQSSTDPGHKKFSGHPVTLHETVLELLQVGFHPLKLDFLFQKLESIITLVLDEYVEKFHIPVMESCEAYIVPDPYDILKEGQIHFKSSEPLINPITGEQTNLILGDVLVSRNPTRLPSDIQKVKAIAHPQLSNFVNVIVFPVKGKQSLASFLGGGDYDGDTVMLNWNKLLVEQFKGSPLCAAPANLSTFFEREVVHVRDFDKQVSKLGSKEAQKAFQEKLLLGLAETKVGLYSKFHDAAVYEYGYGSKKAIHLAYMFTTCLDASKTGLRVKPDVFTQDRQQWGSKKLWYVHELKKKKGFQSTHEENVLERKDISFILDVLVVEGQKLKVEALRDYQRLKIQSWEHDPDLSGPWNAAKARATEARRKGISGFAENMEDIKLHVKRALEEYKRAVVISKGTPAQGISLSDNFEKAASLFAESPSFKGFVFFSDDDIQTLKASFASTESLSFAFSVAFRDICAIKARAGGDVAITQHFAQCFTIPNIVTRSLSQAHGGT